MTPPKPQILPDIFPLPYAIEWGQDAFGIFMLLDLQGIQQGFRWIKPGTFLMGSKDELESGDDELQHEVTLSQGYWLADTACTQALWQAVMAENPSEFKGGVNLPVETVSWIDVQKFIEQLNDKHPGLKARLPTEAEWEYACRAGTTTPFAFGATISTDQVNYDRNFPYVGAKKGILRKKTVPVKSLPVNPWGLYEMHGNVWEWCSDWYGTHPDQAVTDPKGPVSGVSRVLRGGSWFDSARSTRSAGRYTGTPLMRVFTTLVSGWL